MHRTRSVANAQGFGRAFVEADSAKTGCRLYVHIRETEDDAEQKEAGGSDAEGSDSGPGPMSVWTGFGRAQRGRDAWDVCTHDEDSGPFWRRHNNESL